MKSADWIFAFQSQKIHDVNEQIGKALAKMEELGNEGNVDQSMEMSKTVEELKDKRKEYEVEKHSLGRRLSRKAASIKL